MIIVGERLNSSRKVVLNAFLRKDKNFLQEQGKKQEQAGARCILSFFLFGLLELIEVDLSCF